MAGSIGDGSSVILKIAVRATEKGDLLSNCDVTAIINGTTYKLTYNGLYGYIVDLGETEISSMTSLIIVCEGYKTYSATNVSFDLNGLTDDVILEKEETINDKLTSIKTSKASIKSAIQGKGVSCGDTLADYGNRVEAIEQGAPTIVVDAQLDHELYLYGNKLEGYINNIWLPNGNSVIIDLEPILQENNIEYDNSKVALCYDGKKRSGGFLLYDIIQDVVYSDGSILIGSYIDYFPVGTKFRGSTFKHLGYVCVESDIYGDLSGLFYDCQDLVDIAFFDVMGKLGNLSNMFYNCISLVSVPVVINSETENIANMCFGCTSLVNFPSADAMDFSGVSNAANAFTHCTSLSYMRIDNLGCDLNLSDCPLDAESLDYIISHAKEVTGKTLTLGATNLAKLTDEQKAVATAKGWTLA